MSLSKIIAEIKQLKPFADEDVESGPRETLTARRGRKAQSIERLKDLKDEYKKEFLNSATFLVVVGDKRNDLTALATEFFKGFVANPNDVYEDLANRVSPSVYMGKESVVNVFDILGRHLEDKARELGIVEYPQLIFKQQYRVVVRTKEDFVSLVRTAVNEQVGAELAGIQAATSLVGPAIDKEYNGDTAAIFLPTDNAKLAIDLVLSLERLKPQAVVMVVAGEVPQGSSIAPGSFSIKEPTKENVKQMLKTVSKSKKGR